MVKKVLLSLLPALALVCFTGLANAQTGSPAQRLEQEVIINGQQVIGVMTVQNGAVQSYTCSSPQEYEAVDRSSSGWACYDQSTGTWLLHGVPPQTSAVNNPPANNLPANDQPTNDQAAVYYQPGSDGYPYPYYSAPYPYAYSYPYPYSYPYYPYPYGFYGGPAFAFGFGFGHGYYGHGYYGGHGHFDGHSHGGFSHGGFSHGAAPHGSFGHMGGGGFHGGGGGFHGGGGGFHGGGHR